jgi:hypothetical protein
VTKPADFMLGLLDFFGVLLPGMVATWLAWLHLPANLQDSIGAQSGENASAARWAIFLFSSYALGHFVFAAGSKLDAAYDQWRKRARKNDVAYRATQELRKQLTPELAASDFSTLKWARIYVGIHNAVARLEIDRYEATSKFFRSMVVVAAAVGMEFLLASPNTGMVVASVGTCALSFERFCDQRWKMTELTYAAAVISKATSTTHSSGEGASKDRATETSGDEE